MTTPVQPSGPGDITPPQQPKPAAPEKQSYKDVAADKERQMWWKGYFSDKQLVQFKNNLLKFLSAQLKWEQDNLKKAYDRLKEVEEGKE